LKEDFPESNKIVLLYSFNFIITASDTSGQPLLATVPLLLDICHLCLKPISVSIRPRTTCIFFGPATVGHLSSLSAIPSLSAGQPFNAAKPNTSGQASSLSAIPSPSVSGQPFNAAKPNTSGQASALS
jgi:hypothetical protein